MGEQWTPTTDDFRQVWAAFNGYGGLVTRPHSVSMDEGYAEFDRWLAQVKADAWDEGHDAATDEAPDGVWPDAWIDTPNPYRQEAQR